LHGIRFENDACFRREMKEYSHVLLSQHGHVVAISPSNRDQFAISTTEFICVAHKDIQPPLKSPTHSKASLFGGISAASGNLVKSRTDEEEKIRRNDQIIREKEAFLRQLKENPKKALELLTLKLRNQGDERTAEVFAAASTKLLEASLPNSIKSQDSQSAVATESCNTTLLEIEARKTQAPILESVGMAHCDAINAVDADHSEFLFRRN
jgi:hypothetical protein